MRLKYPCGVIYRIKLNKTRIGLKNPAFSPMSTEGRDRTKQIQKQGVLHSMVRPGGTVHLAYYPEALATHCSKINSEI